MDYISYPQHAKPVHNCGFPYITLCINYVENLSIRIGSHVNSYES